MSVETCLFRSSLCEFETCLLKRPQYEAAYGTDPVVTSERAARYGSLMGGRAARAYPETDLAPRDRIRAGPCATTPVAGLGLAQPIVAAARLYGRAGEPGHRVCRCTPPGAVLWTVAVHLGDADRPDLDLPNDRVLRRRPPGRPPPGREAPVSVSRRGGSPYRRHPDPVATDPLSGPVRLRAGVRGAGAGLTDFRHRAVRRTGDPARHGLALRDPASHPGVGNGRERSGRRLRPGDAGEDSGDVPAGLLADPDIRDASNDFRPGVSPGGDLDRRALRAGP